MNIDVTISGRKFTRRLDVSYLTTMKIEAGILAEVFDQKMDKNLILVDEEKLIFCGPRIDDGCKTT